MLTSRQCFGVCLRGARFDPLCDLPGVSVLWLIYSHKSWGSDVHLFREYQSLSCHQSLPTSLFDISTVSLLTNGSGLVVRIESSRYSGEKTLSTTVTYLFYDTWSKSILSTLVIRDDWIVSMTWLRIRSNSNSQKTRGWWHTVSENYGGYSLPPFTPSTWGGVDFRQEWLRVLSQFLQWCQTIILLWGCKSNKFNTRNEHSDSRELFLQLRSG